MLQLRESEREHLQFFIIVGAWIEAMYIATSLYAQNPNPKLRDKIGEQKITLEQILLVLDLDIYKDKKQIQKIAKKLQALKPIFDQIRILVYAGESKLVEKGDELIVEQGSYTRVYFGEEINDRQENLEHNKNAHHNVQKTDNKLINELIVAIRNLRAELIMRETK